MSSIRLQQLLALLAESPADSFLLFAIAKEYEGAGDSDRAGEYYRRLLDGDPDYVGAYYHLAKLYESQGHYREAFRTYSTGMETARKAGDQHALGELAAARLNLGDEEDFF